MTEPEDASRSAVFAAVDLGGTNIKGVLAGGEGEILASREVFTEASRGTDHVLERMAGLVETLAHEVGSEVQAVGVGCPGLVDLERGSTDFLPNLPGGWRGVPVVERLGSRLGVPVYLLNDVRMATLGELVYGYGKDRPEVTMAFFALGTGIGGGVVVDGKLRLGRSGSAGELGHQVVEPFGRRCACGGIGCLETVASAPALIGEGVRLLSCGQAPELRRLTRGDHARVDPRLLAEAVRAGDADVSTVVDRAGFYLGVAISNVVVSLQPDGVVLGGGVAAMGELLLEPIRRVITQRSAIVPVDRLDLLCSELGSRAGALGGIALARRGGLGGHRA